ncbi:hypothetical protein [Fibrella aquatica]
MIDLQEKQNELARKRRELAKRKQANRWNVSGFLASLFAGFW